MKLEMLLVEGQLWTCMRFSDCHTLRRKKSKIFEWWEMQPKVYCATSTSIYSPSCTREVMIKRGFDFSRKSKLLCNVCSM